MNGKSNLNFSRSTLYNLHDVLICITLTNICNSTLILYIYFSPLFILKINTSLKMKKKSYEFEIKSKNITSIFYESSGRKISNSCIGKYNYRYIYEHFLTMYEYKYYKFI